VSFIGNTGGPSAPPVDARPAADRAPDGVGPSGSLNAQSVSPAPVQQIVRDAVDPAEAAAPGAPATSPPVVAATLPQAIGHVAAQSAAGASADVRVRSPLGASSSRNAPSAVDATGGSTPAPGGLPNGSGVAASNVDSPPASRDTHDSDDSDDDRIEAMIDAVLEKPAGATFSAEQNILDIHQLLEQMRQIAVRNAWARGAVCFLAEAVRFQYPYLPMYFDRRDIAEALRSPLLIGHLQMIVREFAAYPDRARQSVQKLPDMVKQLVQIRYADVPWSDDFIPDEIVDARALDDHLRAAFLLVNGIRPKEFGAAAQRVFGDRDMLIGDDLWPAVARNFHRSKSLKAAFYAILPDITARDAERPMPSPVPSEEEADDASRERPDATIRDAAAASSSKEEAKDSEGPKP
jgi:hypothetical protein